MLALLLTQSFGFDPAFIGGGLYPEEGFSSPVVEWFDSLLVEGIVDLVSGLGLYLSKEGGGLC